eukprot:1628077-Amphidinium_carterae.1
MLHVENSKHSVPLEQKHYSSKQLFQTITEQKLLLANNTNNIQDNNAATLLDARDSMPGASMSSLSVPWTYNIHAGVLTQGMYQNHHIT